jgi:hypothetical protein
MPLVPFVPLLSSATQQWEGFLLEQNERAVLMDVIPRPRWWNCNVDNDIVSDSLPVDNFNDQRLCFPSVSSVDVSSAPTSTATPSAHQIQGAHHDPVSPVIQLMVGVSENG